MSKGHRAVALGLLIAALSLAALGQFYFLRRPEYLWDGLAFCALAALFFVLAWRRSKATARARHSLRFSAWLPAPVSVTALLAVGLFLSAVATLLSHDLAWNRDTRGVVAIWLSGVGAAVVAAFWPSSAARPLPADRRTQLRSRLGHFLPPSLPGRDAWLEIAAVAALTGLAFVLRGTALGSLPYTLGGDEAWHGLLARQVVDHQLRNPFVMGAMSMPTLFYWPLSWSLRLVGDSMVGLRLPAALAGTATVPVLYLFARSLGGRRIGLVSAALLATYDYHIHYSRLGANNVWDPLWVMLALWFLDRGLTCPAGTAMDQAGYVPEGKGLPCSRAASTRARCFILAGLVMGLAVYFYTGARLLPALAIAYVGFHGLQRLRRPVAGPDERLLHWLVLLVVPFLIMAGPMLGYALAHPNEWNARINQVGIVQSGWLAREPDLTGKSTAQILVEQFLRAAGAFHVFPDRTVWYGPGRPLLGFVAGVFAILGMAWAVAHAGNRRYFLVLLWFWSVIITGGMLTESPPSSQRLVMAIPTVVLLVAVGLEKTVRLAGRHSLRLRVVGQPVPGRQGSGDAGRTAGGWAGWARRSWQDLVLGLLALVIATSSVHFYFVEFAPSGRYGSENGETATMIGHYLAAMDSGTHAYFFGAPRIYWSFGTMSFLAPQILGQDVLDPLQAPPDWDLSLPAVFVFLPERVAELTWVRQAFSEGYVREFRDAGGRLRFTAYEVQSAP